MQLRTVRKKRKRPIEEKIKSNQMKILTAAPSSSGQVSGPSERMSCGRIRRQAIGPKLAELLALVVLSVGCLNIGHILVSGSSLSDFDGATFYKAPVGSRIRIACNASHWNDDSISLVLWFKGNPTGSAGQLQPIYTIDARQKPLSSGLARHLVSDSLKGRARFVFPQLRQTTASSTAPTTTTSNSSSQQQQQQLVPYLDLAPIEADDQAEYRCRVDYRSRPRENFLIILFVLGRPPPAIVWKRAGRVIDDSYLTLNDFLTLKLASGTGASSTPLIGPAVNGRRHLDNYLTPVQQTSSPARDNQTTENKLADWLAWPEFNYFSSPWSASFAPGEEGNEPALTRPRAELPPAQLIDLQVDSSTTTAVNVLHLNELTRSHLLDAEWPSPPEEASSGNRRGAAPSAQLECHASNEHYDLHTLIKLFAPPSLQELPQVGPSDTTTTTTNSTASAWPVRPAAATNRNWPTQSGAGGGLMPAIERAIWANLNSSALLERSPSGRSEQASSNFAHLRSQQQQPLQRQHQPEDVATNAQSGLQLAQQQRQGSGAREPNWPLVIQQQLIRPHQQLVSNVAEAAAPQTTGAAATKPPGAFQLSRSKLIALEANLRPLDVKITGPSRPLSAGQVHEFTCQSSGSRPPARLSWFKNGLKLDPPLMLADRVHHSNSSSNSPQLEPHRNRQDDEPYKLSGAFSSSSSLISQSRITIKLERQDHNARLSCLAENDHFKLPQSPSASPSDWPDQSNEKPSSSSSGNQNIIGREWKLEDALTLNVHYLPQARLELGNRMLSERIREGQDIYFVCRCDSNPAVNEITWLHNDRPVGDGQPQGSPSGQSSPVPTLNASASQKRADPSSAPLEPANLIVSNDSLVLQRAQIGQSGQYSCLASNSEGVGLSNQIELRVLHAPICVTSSNLLAGGSPPPATTSDASGQLTSLALGSFRLPPKRGRPLRITCQMLVPDELDETSANQLEFSWYLNSSLNERRLLARHSGTDVKLIDVRQSDLLGLPWPMPPPASPLSELNANRSPGPRPNSAARAGSIQQQQRVKMAASRKLRVAEAHLELDWSQADGGSGTQIGQLLCLARNSIGDQKRACLYSIEPAGDRIWPTSTSDNNNSNRPIGAPVACLSVNVTTNSAWIGCGPSGANHLAGGQQNAQLEITQLDENNDRLRPLADADPASGHGQLSFRFNVLVFSLTWSSADLAQERRHQEATPTRQLEANLSSGPLSEPLFAVTNLRPDTDYLLEIDDLGASKLARANSDELDGDQLGPRPPAAIVSLRTLAEHGDLPANRGQRPVSSGGATSQPSIRQVTEPHRPDLLAAALISTRSTSNSFDQTPGRPLQQRQARQQQSVWSSLSEALGQLVGIQSPNSPSPTSGGRARRPQWATSKGLNAASSSAGSGPVQARLWPLSDAWNNPLGLCICLALLLTLLIGSLFVRRRCFRRRATRHHHQDETKLSPLKSHNNNDSNEQDNEQDNDDRTRESGPRSVSSSSKAPSSSSTPPDKSRQTIEQLADTSLTCLAAPSPSAGRMFQNHHYSTLNSRLVQHLALPDGVVGQSLAVASPQPSSINFLKSSSIASASATMRRNLRQHQPVMILQTQSAATAGHDHGQVPFTSTVTRSRSSLGFGASGCADAVADASLMLLAHMQTAAGKLTPQRLIQPSDNESGGGRHTTSLEQTSLLADEIQSGKWLISDANFSFGATETSGATLNATETDRHQHRQSESWPYIGIKTSNRVKLNNLDADRRARAETNLCAINGNPSRPNRLSPQSGCCTDNDYDKLPACNCNELAQTFISPIESDVCCPSSHHHSNHQQRCAEFIELIPGQQDEQATILTYDQHNQPTFELLNGQTPMGTSAIPSISQRPAHDKQYQLIFNQSLNSSSIGSQSTNNQYGSSPLGSLTNTTPSNTESYQHNNKHNNMLVATSSDEQHDGDDASCRQRDGRASELTLNASNHSSDGFSFVATDLARVASKRSTAKPRLASILKNCNHSINDALQ